MRKYHKQREEVSSQNTAFSARYIRDVKCEYAHRWRGHKSTRLRNTTRLKTRYHPVPMRFGTGPLPMATISGFLELYAGLAMEMVCWSIL